jgi:benzoyl-CoA reductase/2-hydroxyglutaryl-CoA dehydratase subunit BcrC/BadD/HgdB
MKTVIYSSPFVPAEWIAAHGLRPMRVMPGTCADAPVSGEGLCPYTRAYLNEPACVPGAAGIVFTTDCDQMRRASELAKAHFDQPVFLMNVPTTWETPTAQKLYMSEVLRLGRFLVRIGGKTPTDHELAVVMLEYDITRAALKSSRGRLPPRKFSEAIADFHRSGGLEMNPSENAPAPRGVPLALVGGPMLRQHLDLFDVIEEAGGAVVLDATTTGERTLAGPFDRRTLRDDPFNVLVDAYFGHIPDAFQRPNSRLYAWLRKEIADRGVKGILFKRFTWCDTWHGEVQRMKEWSHLPLLSIDTGDDDRIQERIASRIHAFLEVLK